MEKQDNLFLLLILRGKNPSSLRIRLAAGCSWMVFHRLFLPTESIYHDRMILLLYKNTAVLFSLFSTSLYIPFFDLPESGRTPALQQERGSHGLLYVHSLKCWSSAHHPSLLSHSWPVMPLLSGTSCIPPLWSALLDHCLLALGPLASCHSPSDFRSHFCLSAGLLGHFGSYWYLGS